MYAIPIILSYTNVHPFRESWQFNVYCFIWNDGVVALELTYRWAFPWHRNLFYDYNGAHSYNELQETFYSPWVFKDRRHLWPHGFPPCFCYPKFLKFCTIFLTVLQKISVSKNRIVNYDIPLKEFHHFVCVIWLSLHDLIR